MTKKEKETQKEEELKKIFQIWFDYLTQSKDYKDLCDWVYKAAKNPKLSPPEKFRKDLPNGVNSILGEKWEGPGWKMTRTMNGEGVHPLVYGFTIWGDIHRLSFEKFWEFKKGTFLAWNRAPSVINYQELAEYELNKIIDGYRKANGRNPSLKEFKEYFLSHLKSPAHILIKIDLFRDKPNEELGDECCKLITRIKKDSSKIINFLHWRGAWRQPTGYPTTRIHLDSLSRFLKVYKSHKLHEKEKNKWQKIIKDIYPCGHPSELKDQESMLNVDLKKANKILQNVEKGIFPGK